MNAWVKELEIENVKMIPDGGEFTRDMNMWYGSQHKILVIVVGDMLW